MKIVGKTIDGIPVVDKCQIFVGTHGLPLAILIDNLSTKNLQIDWMDYIKCAMNDGARVDTVFSNILDAVSQCYGPDYKREVEIRLQKVRALL